MGPNPIAKRVPVLLDVLPFPGFPAGSGVPGDPVDVPCPHCSSALTLHQPDVGLPDRLLAVCEGCHRWYLIDLVPGQDEGFLVGLPGDGVVRDLSRADPSGGISLMGPEPAPGPLGDPPVG